jgi:hypothetical protein
MVSVSGRICRVRTGRRGAVAWVHHREHPPCPRTSSLTLVEQHGLLDFAERREESTHAHVESGLFGFSHHEPGDGEGRRCGRPDRVHSCSTERTSFLLRWTEVVRRYPWNADSDGRALIQSQRSDLLAAGSDGRPPTRKCPVRLRSPRQRAGGWPILPGSRSSLLGRPPHRRDPPSGQPTPRVQAGR